MVARSRGGGGRTRWSTEGFGAVKLFCMTPVVVDTSSYVGPNPENVQHEELPCQLWTLDDNGVPL